MIGQSTLFYSVDSSSNYQDIRVLYTDAFTDFVGVEYGWNKSSGRLSISGLYFLDQIFNSNAVGLNPEYTGNIYRPSIDWPISISGTLGLNYLYSWLGSENGDEIELYGTVNAGYPIHFNNNGYLSPFISFGYFGERGGVVSSSRDEIFSCLLYTSPSPRDRTRSRMPSSA